ncbi:tRNA-binding protein [Alphaproteobacteria bacterium]|nr:tRNA-binding protein [Alphaproteobacteria bacterium]
MIEYGDFEKIDIRVGTVLEARLNDKSNKPSIILIIDFGEVIGRKKTSAQLTKHYKPEDLIGKQVAAVTNFPPKQIGKMISEVLVLGFPDEENNPILVMPTKKIRNGGKLF